MSISSLFESGYEGDMEDEGEYNIDDFFFDEELFSELVDGEYVMLNK